MCSVSNYSHFICISLGHRAQKRENQAWAWGTLMSSGIGSAPQSTLSTDHPATGLERAQECRLWGLRERPSRWHLLLHSTPHSASGTRVAHPYSVSLLSSFGTLEGESWVQCFSVSGCHHQSLLSPSLISVFIKTQPHTYFPFPRLTGIHSNVFNIHPWV